MLWSEFSCEDWTSPYIKILKTKFFSNSLLKNTIVKKNYFWKMNHVKGLIPSSQHSLLLEYLPTSWAFWEPSYTDQANLQNMCQTGWLSRSASSVLKRPNTYAKKLNGKCVWDSKNKQFYLVHLLGYEFLLIILFREGGS